jgi:L-aspartate oxidase
VFAKRIAADIGAYLPPQRDPVFAGTEEQLVGEDVKSELQQTMTRHAGVLRSEDSLASATATCAELFGARGRPRTVTWEATNLLTVASALLEAAMMRRETRGCHWREEFPDASPDFLGHVLLVLDTVTWEKST